MKKIKNKNKKNEKFKFFYILSSFINCHNYIIFQLYYQIQTNSILLFRNKKGYSTQYTFQAHKYFLVDITVKNFRQFFRLHECITKLYIRCIYNQMHEYFCKQKHMEQQYACRRKSRGRIQCGHIIAVERIQWVDCELREARGGLTPRRLITSFLALARSQSLKPVTKCRGKESWS